MLSKERVLIRSLVSTNPFLDTDKVEKLVSLGKDNILCLEPGILVARDQNGVTYILDGNHRVKAMERLSIVEAEVDIQTRKMNLDEQDLLAWCA